MSNKYEWWGVGVVVCLEQGADCLHMLQLMPLHPKTLSCLASFKSRLAYPGCPGKEAVVVVVVAVKCCWQGESCCQESYDWSIVLRWGLYRQILIFTIVQWMMQYRDNMCNIVWLVKWSHNGCMFTFIDERALVEGARQLGFVFSVRTPQFVTVSTVNTSV